MLFCEQIRVDRGQPQPETVPVGVLGWRSEAIPRFWFQASKVRSIEVLRADREQHGQSEGPIMSIKSHQASGSKAGY